MRGAFEASGDIRGVDLLAALVALWREKASGSLRFSRPGVTAGFDLERGEVTASLSSQSQFDTTAILIRAGKLDVAAVERLEIGEQTDPSTALLQAGLVTAREWKWGQKIRAIEILSDVLGWLEGTYEYAAEAGPSSPGSGFPIPRLLLELFLRSRDRTLVEHYLGPSDLPLLRAEDFDGAFEAFALTADAGSVVRLIDGHATAEEIAEKAVADEFAVLKLLAALTTLGLVHPAEAASAPARPSPPSRRQRREAKREAPRPKAPKPPRSEPEAPSPRETNEMPETPAPEEPAGPEAPAESPPVLIAGPSPQAEAEEFPDRGPLEAAEPLDEAPPVLPFEPVAAPADLVPNSFEAAARREEEKSLELDFRMPSGPADEPASVPEGRGPGVWLVGLLAVLVLAVAAIVVFRARGRETGESAAGPAVEPSARENPVFPPAETAVPLRAAVPSRVSTPPRTSTPTRPPATKPPAVLATRPAPTKTTTPAPTRPAPTKTPTRVPTRPPATKPPAVLPTRPAPTKTPTRAPTRPAPTKAPTLAPSRPVPTRTSTPAPPARRSPTALPARAPSRAPLPTRSPAAQAAAPQAEFRREDWLRRAENDRRSLSNRRGVRYAIQLEIACELPTLERAWNWDKPPGTMWLLTSAYRGRTCFRVLWGRYATLSQARAAKGRVPGFFVAPGNRPAIVSVR